MSDKRGADYKIIETIFGILLIFTFLLSIIWLATIIYEYLFSGNKRENIIAYVIIATSLTAGSFYFIRLYIENQLSIKEAKMNKEYQDSLNKLDEKMGKRMDAQTKEFNERMNTLTKELKELILNQQTTPQNPTQSQK